MPEQCTNQLGAFLTVKMMHICNAPLIASLLYLFPDEGCDALYVVGEGKGGCRID